MILILSCGAGIAMEQGRVGSARRFQGPMSDGPQCEAKLHDRRQMHLAT
jgi:hypothetical protein